MMLVRLLQRWAWWEQLHLETCPPLQLLQTQSSTPTAQTNTTGTQERLTFSSVRPTSAQEAVTSTSTTTTTTASLPAAATTTTSIWPSDVMVDALLCGLLPCLVLAIMLLLFLL